MSILCTRVSVFLHDTSCTCTTHKEQERKQQLSAANAAEQEQNEQNEPKNREHLLQQQMQRQQMAQELGSLLDVRQSTLSRVPTSAK